MELTGTIKEIFDTQNVTGTFKKREFVVEMEDGAYSQLIKLEMTQDKCDILNDYEIGQEVKVDFNLRGRGWTPKDGGETRYFNTLQAWRIASGEAQPAPPVQGAPKREQQVATAAPNANDDDLPF